MRATRHDTAKEGQQFPPNKHERSNVKNTSLNAEEMAWWNTHAALIAKTWEYDENLTILTRGNYLDDAARFFQPDMASDSFVLELGCGTGWVGQHLARSGIRVYGTDFSEAQIALATAQAATRGVSGLCTYGAADSVGFPTKHINISGVLIHAFLHHLDEIELAQLLDALKNRLNTGTKIWIYEPSCYTKTAMDTFSLEKTVEIEKNIAEALVQKIHEATSEFFDFDTHNAFSNLMEIAAKNGWYLSPKEVPLDIDSFTAEAEKRGSSG